MRKLSSKHAQWAQWPITLIIIKHFIAYLLPEFQLDLRAQAIGVDAQDLALGGVSGSGLAQKFHGMKADPPDRTWLAQALFEAGVGQLDQGLKQITLARIGPAAAPHGFPNLMCLPIVGGAIKDEAVEVSAIGLPV